MHIRVLFFGLTADIVGLREMGFDLPNASNSETIIKRVIATFPRLASHQLLFSVNQQYATGEETLLEGDEIAIFTAVSGG